MRPEERLPRNRTARVGFPEQLSRAAKDLVGLGHAAHSPLALGELTFVWADERHAALAKDVDVGASRRMRPHAGIHRRRDEDVPAMRERSFRDDVVRETVCELRDRVGRRGGDHEQVRAREMRVRIVGPRPPCEGEERLLADEPVGRRRHERKDVVAGPHEEPHELARLVRGDAAGDPYENAGHEPILPATSCRST
jgi:hypothetical protein